MMDFEDSKQHREEMLREAETNRLAESLGAARKRCASRASLLVWELKRIAGRLPKCQESEEVSRFVIRHHVRHGR